ncbi:MAG: ribonuclease HI, partial [Planctomycetota bacterium]
MKTAPHYLLFTEAKDLTEPSAFGGRWRFVLEEIGSDTRIEETEIEPGVVGERLQLLVVVRGLESLCQPSRVTLITPSRYVGRGIRLGLSQWRENRWHWESFGMMKPINHLDLWKRVDHAMSF